MLILENMTGLKANNQSVADRNREQIGVNCKISLDNNHINLFFLKSHI